MYKIIDCNLQRKKSNVVKCHDYHVQFLTLNLAVTEKPEVSVVMTEASDSPKQTWAWLGQIDQLLTLKNTTLKAQYLKASLCLSPYLLKIHAKQVIFNNFVLKITLKC